MGSRLVAPVVLVLGVTVVAFALVRVDARRDARRDAEDRADTAAAEVRNGLEQSADLVETLRRFMFDHAGDDVPNSAFAAFGVRWLSPVGLPAAGWIEETRARSPRPSLATGASPMAAPGDDLGSDSVLAAALLRPRTQSNVTATPFIRVPDGRVGMFLVRFAPRPRHGEPQPGFLVLFVPASWLMTAVTSATSETTSSLQLRAGEATYGGLGTGTPVRNSFSSLGRRFEVAVQEQPVQGASRLLSWFILGGGLLLAALVAWFSLLTRRRDLTQRELDRVFSLSPDIIAVAGFDGHWKRVNPALQSVLGYSEREALSHPYLDFVHPHDRAHSEAETRAVIQGKSTRAFANRMVCKDGSVKWVEWTATASAEDEALYGVGRDVTERQRSKSQEAALRRVATLAAERVQPERLFQVVAEEIARVIEVSLVRVVRYEAGDTATEYASFATGSMQSLFDDEHFSLEGTNVLRLVRERVEAARIDNFAGLDGEIAQTARAGGIRSAVGAPIIAMGRLWGAVIVASTDLLPTDTETRLSAFTELLATAIGGAQSQEAFARLADEQAALRHVATLAAAEVPSEELFAAAVEEVGRLLPVTSAALGRYEPDGMYMTVAAWSSAGVAFPVGQRWISEGNNVTGIVHRTGSPARLDDYSEASGPIGIHARDAGYRSAVGSPIVVAGRLWGNITAATTADEPLPPGTEVRIAQFAGLVGTAIANADAREELRHLAEEQAALRRVATLVARRVSDEELFAAVADEVAAVLGVTRVTIDRYEADHSSTVVGSYNSFPVGSRWPLDGPSLGATVFETARPGRIDDYAGLESTSAAEMRSRGIEAAVGAPILVEGRVWGVICVARLEGGPLPEGTEQRLVDFTALIATAIGDADARDALARLAAEQTALRRVATLVAERTTGHDLYAAVAAEVSSVLDVDRVTIDRYDSDASSVVLASLRGDGFPVGSRWPHDGPSLGATVLATGKPTRIEDYRGMESTAAAIQRSKSVSSAVGVPILVGGQVWGVICVSKSGGRVPDGTEQRLEDFTALIGTAIANAGSRDALARLAEEQAALRRVATLVAQGVQPAEVFAAVTDEVGRLFRTNQAGVIRFEPDALLFVGASKGIQKHIALGTRWPVDSPIASAEVYRTGSTARVDGLDWAVPGLSGGTRASDPGIVSTVASPIVVEGRPWGTVSVSSTDEPLPPDTGRRLEEFTQLVATAIANAESGAARSRLVDEQAALRRVATLVAEGVTPAEVFSAVSKEVASLFGLDDRRKEVGGVVRFDPGPQIVLVGVSSAVDEVPLGTSWEPTELYASTRVLRTGRSALVDESELASVGGPDAEFLRRIDCLFQAASPIVVEGRLWGAITMNAAEALPLDAADRLEKFTELIGTAIANAEARGEVERLADEHAALRRVATLVAQGAQPGDVFAAVAEEAGRLLSIEGTRILRYGPDETAAVVAAWDIPADRLPELEVGATVKLDGETVSTLVHRSGEPARVDGYGQIGGTVGPLLHERGVKTTVGAPIVVEGRLWGVMLAASLAVGALPVGTEQRLAKFTELVAIAIANAESRTALAASRARIVAASDDARRRIERDLHDGAQQRLVSLGLDLRMAEASVPDDLPDLEARISRVAHEMDGVIDDLREMSRGIHPAVLTDGGLEPAIETLARRAALPVELDLDTQTRLAPHVEVAAYYVVAEALTNTAKHANAKHARVALAQWNGRVRLSIDDDGEGGADASGGSGLLGLRDRVEALGGSLTVSSPPGKGTLITVDLPVSDEGVRPAE